MKKMLALFVAVAALAAGATAQEKKAAPGKPIEGVMVCTKCTLGETDKCGHAVKVKDGEKEVVYYIDDKGGKEAYHKAVCPGGSEKAVKVTGKVVEKDGKKTITMAKVEMKK